MGLFKRKTKIELVGLTFGNFEHDHIKITDFVSMKNLDDSPVSFSLDYEVFYREIQNHEKKGEVLVGIFHTHPEEAQGYPSEKDIHFMRNWPYPYLWLIGKGGTEPQISIYSLKDEKILNIPYIISNT
jgi:proteasome lid subunit RPN8/RPN11